LFPELRNPRNTNKWTVHEVERVLDNLLDEDELKIIECKLLTNERVRDSDSSQSKISYVTTSED